MSTNNTITHILPNDMIHKIINYKYIGIDTYLKCYTINKFINNHIINNLNSIYFLYICVVKFKYISDWIYTKISTLLNKMTDDEILINLQQILSVSKICKNFGLSLISKDHSYYKNCKVYNFLNCDIFNEQVEKYTQDDIILEKSELFISLDVINNSDLLTMCKYIDKNISTSNLFFRIIIDYVLFTNHRNIYICDNNIRNFIISHIINSDLDFEYIGDIIKVLYFCDEDSLDIVSNLKQEIFNILIKFNHILPFTDDMVYYTDILTYTVYEDTTIDGYGYEVSEIMIQIELDTYLSCDDTVSIY